MVVRRRRPRAGIAELSARRGGGEPKPPSHMPMETGCACHTLAVASASSGQDGIRIAGPTPKCHWRQIKHVGASPCAAKNSICTLRVTSTVARKMRGRVRPFLSNERTPTENALRQ